MASFLDYYNEELRKRGAPVAGAPLSVPNRLSSMSFSGEKPDENPVLGVGKWLLDILDRPRNAVANVAKNAIDRGVAAGEAFSRGDGGEGFANTLGAIFGAIPAAAKGLTSTDAADKISTSNLIEYGTDKIGAATDPNYVDQKNNVNEQLKGTVGFFGDVLSDPLMFVPGTVLLKAGKGVARAADKGLSALSGGTRSVTQASKDAVEAAATESRAARADLPEARENPAGVRLDFDEFDTADIAEAMRRATPRADAQAPRAAQSSVASEMRALPPGRGLPAVNMTPRTEVLDEITERLAEAPRLASSPAEEAVQTARGRLEPKPTGDDVVHPEIPSEVLSGGAIPQPGGSLEGLVMASPRRGDIQQFLADLSEAGRGRTVPDSASEWAATLPASHQVVLRDGRASMSMAEIGLLQNQMRAAAQAGDTAGFNRVKQQLSPFMARLREDYTKAASSSRPVANNAEAFLRMVSDDYRKVENQLGSDLYNFLQRNHSPAKFDRLVQDISSVVELKPGLGDLLRTMDQNLARELSSTLGLPRLAKPNTPEEAAEWVAAALRGNDEYQKGISGTVQAVLKAQLDRGGYPFELTADGLRVHRTTLAKGEGLGKYADQFNTFTQVSISRKLLPMIEKASQITARAKGSKSSGFSSLAGRARTLAFKDAKLRALDDVARNLDALGVSVVIGHGRNTSMLSEAEVYRGILAAAEDRGTQNMVDLALFNHGTEVIETHLLTAVQAALQGASRAEVREILTSTRKLGAKGELAGKKGAVGNNLATPKKSSAYTSWSAAVDAAVQDLKISRTEAKKFITKKEAGRAGRTQNVYYVNYYQGGENRLADELADSILDAAASLKLRAAENEAAYVARAAGEAHDLATQSVQKTNAILGADEDLIETTKALSSWKKDLAEDAAEIAATPDGLSAAERLAEASMGDDLTKTISSLQRASAASEKATSPVALVQATDELVDDVAELVSKEIRDGASPDLFSSALPFDEAGDAALAAVRTADPIGDLSKDADVFVDAFGRQIQDPYGRLKAKIQSGFSQNYKAPNVMPEFTAWSNSMAGRASYINTQLRGISKAARAAGDVDGSLLRSAFSNVQRGVTSTNRAAQEIEDMISGVLRDFFDLNATGSMGNSFLRISGKVDVVNAMLKQKGIPHEFVLDDAMVGKTFDPRLLGDQWKAWEIDDPLDFMHRMNLAREELAINAGVARSFLSLAKKMGAYSDEPKKGFVRVAATGKSRFSAHIPEGTYVSKELFSELQQVETMLRTSREFQGELGRFVREYYGPALNTWKRTITIMRPGHHIRNYIGSTSATWVRRGFNEFRRSHEDAMKILAQRNNYRDVDMLAAAAREGIEQLPQRGDTLLTLSGGRGELKADEVFAYMSERGAMPSFRVSEDFLPSEGRFSDVMDALSLSNTKIGEIAGGVSEYTDHFTRAQHFMQALRQDAKAFPKMSKEQLMERALKETQKYHPDASMLTPLESKLRLVVPFYSWFAKIMPALLESMLMHPGRVTMLNKASYNLAVANGINPDSLYDPFPDDQLFPSFIESSGIGPQFKLGDSYIRVNPGFAHLDVMETFGDDPFRGLLGMTSPLIRVPFELATGGSLSTGGRIKDTSDYLDQNIPFINYLANLTGYSPTGSLGGILTGKGLDPQAGYQPKADGTTNKSELDQGLTAFNWLTGLGAQNLSRPNYVNYAEIEKRNREGSE